MPYKFISDKYAFVFSKKKKKHVNETRLSDYHKLITTFFKTNFSRLRPKVLTYRNCKNFDESKFLTDLNKTIYHF